jgi:hypothetical protein
VTDRFAVDRLDALIAAIEGVPRGGADPLDLVTHNLALTARRRRMKCFAPSKMALSRWF